MKKQLIYDLPTRVLHWLFAGLFLSAFCISNIFDDESPIFSYHMLIGLILVFVVVLRLIWGLFGTKYARFSGFSLNPIELLRYFQGILTGSKKRWSGHNPATSWAAIIMILLASGLGITGFLMTSGTNRDSIKDIHELLANGFIIIVIFHIAGIIIHSIRHQETSAGFGSRRLRTCPRKQEQVLGSVVK